MKRTYQIDERNEVEVEYERKNNEWIVTNDIPAEFEFLKHVNPEEFKHIEAEFEYNGHKIVLIEEEDGILLTERCYKEFELKFETPNGEETFRELVVYPDALSLDIDDEEFYLIGELGELKESYDYGECSIAHKEYWDSCNLRQWYSDLDENKSKTFEIDGYDKLTLTCVNEEYLYPYETY